MSTPRLLNHFGIGDHVLKIKPGWTGLSAVISKEAGVYNSMASYAEIEAGYVDQRLSNKSCLKTDLNILYRSARLVLGARADVGKSARSHAALRGDLSLE